jgi:hypothetical protein
VAEKEENPSEGDLPDGEGADKKILGLPKPLFIKVAIGVVVLITLAGAGAFFLMGSEDVPAVEEQADTEEAAGEFGLVNSLEQNAKGNAKPDDDAKTPAKMSERIMTLREEAITRKEENLQLREQIFALQTELATLKNDGSQTAKQPKSNQRKPDTAFLNSYGDDSNAFPPIETDPPKPKPEPRWGEFKRPAS